MAFSRRHPARSSAPLACGGVVWCSLWLATASVQVLAQSQVGQGAGIFTCVDSKGNRRTSDRPIAECSDREQRELNKDGSIKRIIPPTLTAEERAEREAAERKAAEERSAYADSVRRDRNLKARFPNEAAHNRARDAALEAVRASMRASEKRIKELEAERKPLKEEAEFYRGRKMPARLRQQIEANETSIAAQRELIQNQEAELVRINRLYDAELAHLRKLWNGAQPGSIGPISVAAGATGAAR